MHVHLVGVAGTGMGALAGLFKASGHDVSGSDVAFYPPMGPALERWGIRLMEGFDPKHLEPRPDLVVIGNVCRPTNPEARAALDSGVPTKSMPHALAELLLAHRSPLVVGGTHGKTTTSALCAWLLHEAGRDPGFLIGGLPKNFDASFRVPGDVARGGRLPLVTGEGMSRRKTPFVVEGDEYDTAFFEKTPKFWHYRPEVAILTSIEHDHIDIYPDEASYLAAFRGFVERVPESGLIVAAAADPRVVDVVRASARAEVAWFALEGDDTHGQPPHWLAAPAEVDENGQSFDLYAGGVYAGRAALTIPGRHNIRNALAAAAAVAQGFGVPLSTVLSALATFQGVRRRQDLLYEVRGVRVYDDFAHHPTAVDETLRALRARHTRGALYAVFEPRSATACRALHQEQYASSFDAADVIVLAPLGRPEIPEAERLDLRALATALEARGKRALTPASVDEIVTLLARDARAGDTIALLSNGAFGGIYDKLRGALAP
ncbi:UDP-N-acetylmuramate--L-alanine ligase [Polyangium jinanense]|uniref:UDP-N-acetylmuramate:L-alanyl-gamma-D-glutamyl-meso-diaminopimelate ligase n=1 Tax=Polyangium jinanense TaxID=2829994 RepID=A0A9X3WXJ9_9BACT|nr:Mur ligase family protein [Polyangium jinanense]MDC3952323.1 UDP-N-acetylmuramate:L-alanyl-gamma-D-glutamyl-meso-diaminopimelate ligase [Polyangium jinanense]MDC3979952.1 UDP-N-acetylmuramate:L-alanyl-gamma-D-glutamyl-meso-diaminopimelate ligase [Polyangium jinanense]